MDDRSAHATVNGAVSERPPMRPTRDLPCEFHEPASTPRAPADDALEWNATHMPRVPRRIAQTISANCGWNLCVRALAWVRLRALLGGAQRKAVMMNNITTALRARRRKAHELGSIFDVGGQTVIDLFRNGP